MDERVQVYQAPDQARGHITGFWYFAPAGYDVQHWAFSRPHETEDLAEISAAAWAARYEEYAHAIH